MYAAAKKKKKEAFVYPKSGSSFDPLFDVAFFLRVPSFCLATE